MEDVVNVNIKHDDSVEKLIEKTAQKLQNKYNKKRNVNEKLLIKKKSGFVRVTSIIFNILCTILVVLVGCVFASIINCRVQGVAPSFAGYSSMKVGSGSMVASGFKIGQNVIVRSVNTSTLKEGDIIAFYLYAPSYSGYQEVDFNLVDTSDITQTEYNLTLSGFFGTQNQLVQKAGKSGCSIIFHKIHQVLEKDGQRWFRTFGTSNLYADGSYIIDGWFVNEQLVLGKYDASPVADAISWTMGVFTSSYGIIIALLIPLVMVGLTIVFQFVCDIQVMKLQLDVIEEKRKIDDPICVKNNVGYRMDAKSKYKVLAQADDKNKNEYIALLWKDGTAPKNIRKYCLRKKLYLKPVERLLEINRVCQDRINSGESPNKVAEFYLEEKAKIQQEQLEYERQFRTWRRGGNAEYNKQENDIQNEDILEENTTKEVQMDKIVDKTLNAEKVEENNQTNILEKKNKKTTKKQSVAKNKLENDKKVRKSKPDNKKKSTIKDKTNGEKLVKKTVINNKKLTNKKLTNKKSSNS